MNMTQPAVPVQREKLQQAFTALQSFLQDARAHNLPLHEVEQHLWRQVLSLGRQALTVLLVSYGSGDHGPTVTLPDGQTFQRLDDLHTRRYVSIFGEFQLERTVYGTREGQAIAFVPLDNQLQLPESDFSYVLQDWAGALGVEEAFAQVSVTLERILDLPLSVDSLERLNRQMAEYVAQFRQEQPLPPPAQAGEIVVTSSDGKGVVMRKEAGSAPAPARRGKGEKANQKRMATVGAIYTIDRYVRTPEQVVEALFREPRESVLPARPKPQFKQVWASMPGREESWSDSLARVYEEMRGELQRRNPGQLRETVHLCDGQEALWQARRDYLPETNMVEILDLMHASERVWTVAHAFYREGSPEATAFARAGILKLLQGGVESLVRSWRYRLKKEKMSAAKVKRVKQCCRYLLKNRQRLRYDEYVAKGYPIASGVIEGACRHLVKDRMERSGMHWTLEGAQAMLEVRSVWVNWTWGPYQAYRIEQEVERLYPYHELVVNEPCFTMAS